MSAFQTCGNVINRMIAQTNLMKKTALECHWCVQFLAIYVIMVLCAYSQLNFVMATDIVKMVLMKAVDVVSKHY